MRVVLDTNVLVSGLLAKGPASRILDLLENGGHEICLTPKILEEVKRILAYPKITGGLRKAGVVPEEAIEWLLQHSSVFKDIDVIKLIAEDPSDNMFLDCAVVSGARWIVSGDKHLRRIGSLGSIRIVSPAEFLKTRRI